MTWMRFEDDRRQQWQLNQEGLWLLCQQLAYAQMMYQRARVVAEDSPLFWRGPDLRNVEFDFSDFHPAKIKRAQEFYAELTHASLRDANSVFNQLLAMKGEMDLLTRRVNEMKRRVASDNADCIERNVDFFGEATKWAKTVRDASATILVAGAAFLSGGAALGVLGAGSTLKGTATYQDTLGLETGRRVGAAMLSAGGSFAVGVIPGIKVTGTAGKVAVMAISAQVTAATTFATGLVQGDGMRKSLVAAVMNTGLSAIPLGDRIKAMALPMAIEFSLAVATSVGGDILTSMAGDAAAKKPPPAHPRPTASAQLEVPVSHRHLVGAITHLDKPVSSQDYILRTAMCPG